jgi:hypothetical protein
MMNEPIAGKEKGKKRPRRKPGTLFDQEKMKRVNSR